jgi:hypothetical protein
MELLDDMRYVGPFGHRVSVGERKDRGLRPMYHKLRNHFGGT